MIAIPISLSNIPRSTRPALVAEPRKGSGTKLPRLSSAAIESCRASPSIVAVVHFWFRWSAKSSDSHNQRQRKTASPMNSKERKRNGSAWNRTRIVSQWIHPGGELTVACSESAEKLLLRRAEFRTFHHKTNNATACSSAIGRWAIEFRFRSVGSAFITGGEK